MARQGQGAWTWSGYHKIRWSYSPGSIDIFKVIGGAGDACSAADKCLCDGYLY